MGEAMEQAMANAFRRQAKNVIYADYKPKEDFTLWLSGYREKIRNAFGLNTAQDAEVNAEVIRSISGKLQCGTALDTYNRLAQEVKVDYDLLIRKLTEEFIDPQDKRRFTEDFTYNKRKKGQSLKDYMQEIIKDQNRYSGMQDRIQVGQDQVPNVAKIKDGIRRFKCGIRNRKGKIDSSQRKHLRYSLLNDDDLTWENALEIACRWEVANDAGSSDSDDDSSMIS